MQQSVNFVGSVMQVSPPRPAEPAPAQPPARAGDQLAPDSTPDTPSAGGTAAAVAPQREEPLAERGEAGPLEDAHGDADQVSFCS